MADSVWVGVPATSANVGVGFDCLGLALDLEARFGFEKSEHLEILGCEERFRGDDNLVLASYRGATRRLGLEPVPLRLTIESPIPLSGGLGSSSACVVAGILAAQALADRLYDERFTLDLATHLEGHPDNVAPAILGGLVSSFVDGKDTVSLHFPVANKLRFVAIAPPYEVRTADARRVLPHEVELSTCVWQMGRIVALVRALECGDMDLLAKAAQDKLHEPYRAKLIPDYALLRERALGAGASAFVISGSGSTMLAICGSDSAAHDVVDAVRGSAEGFWIRICSASGQGARYLEA